MQIKIGVNNNMNNYEIDNMIEQIEESKQNRDFKSKSRNQ